MHTTVLPETLVNDGIVTLTKTYSTMFSRGTAARDIKKIWGTILLSPVCVMVLQVPHGFLNKQGVIKKCDIIINTLAPCLFLIPAKYRLQMFFLSENWRFSII